MVTVISPAKDLDLTPIAPMKGATQPEFIKDSARLIEKLRGLNAKQIAKLMDLSPALAELNHQRFQDWRVPFTAKNSKPAVFTFNGDVYRGLNATTMNTDDLKFAQTHVRILSGLYGSLRPLDLMQAYRLEMGCGFSASKKEKDLYAFWGDRIAESLNAAIKLSGNDMLVNLASNEYFKSISITKLKARVITPVFKDMTTSGYKSLMLFAKVQRGRMCRWIVDNRLREPERLKKYTNEGYRFNEELSSLNDWTFTREKP